MRATRIGDEKILKAYSKDIFDISEHFISVRFPYNGEAVKILDEQADGGIKTAGMQLSESTVLVLQILKLDGTLTQKQIAEHSKLSMRSVQRVIKELNCDFQSLGIPN